MPNLKETRAAVVGRADTHWKTTYPAVKLYFDNTLPTDAEVDQISEYVTCSIRFAPGGQINLSPTPGHRIRGTIKFVAACREGTGSSRVLEYLDSLATAMKFANFGGVVTGEPVPGVPLTSEGWFSYDLSIPFRADSMD